MSHTATVKVEYSDPRVLERAVLNMGGLWYGKGSYSLGDTQQTGYGFRLPMVNGRHKTDTGRYWYHPIVLTENGELAFDAFGGTWGDLSQLTKLKAEYAMASVEQAATDMGWQHERTDAGLVVYHPEGGQITISHESALTTSGFTGTACHTATAALGIKELNTMPTAEASLVAIETQIPN